MSLTFPENWVMAIRDRLLGRRPAAPPAQEVQAQLAPAIMDTPFSTFFGSASYGGYNNYANAILRQDAMAVPTIARCRNLIAGTIAAIPLTTYNQSTGQETASLPWTDQPDPRQPRSITMAWTVDSLFMYGTAYWRVTAIYSQDSRPAQFEWIQNDRIGRKLNQTSSQVEHYTIDGVQAPMDGIGSLITFQGFDQGLLQRSMSTIRAALDLERAAAIAAQTPMGTGILKNSGADLPPDQVTGLLARWKQSRQNNSTAYLTSTIDYTLVGFNPKDMMYNEAKQYLATELARACNVPAYLVDAETFRGMTYQNILDGRKEFTAFSLSPFYTAIEDRLSMDDLTARGTYIKFDVDDTFLRVDPLTRLQVVAQLLELQLITLDQAKAMEDLTPDGSTENATSNI